MSEDAQLIATGGGDAGIRLWTLTDQGADPCPLHVSKLNPPPSLVRTVVFFFVSRQTVTHVHMCFIIIS